MCFVKTIVPPSFKFSKVLKNQDVTLSSDSTMVKVETKNVNPISMALVEPALTAGPSKILFSVNRFIGCVMVGVCFSSFMTAGKCTFDCKCYVINVGGNEEEGKQGNFLLMWNGKSFTHDKPATKTNCTFNDQDLVSVECDPSTGKVTYEILGTNKTYVQYVPKELLQ